jgi:hypothetical protein
MTDRPSSQWLAEEEPPACPECSRAVRESPSAIAAFARLILTNAHREHIRPDGDDLPF